MKLREWKDIIYSKMKEHKKQTVIVLVIFLLAVSGTGVGIYYASLSDKAVSTIKEEQEEKKENTKTPKEKTEDAKTPEEKKEIANPEPTEKTQETEEQKGKEEKEDTATKSNQAQETPSQTSEKSSGQTQQQPQQKPQQPSKKPDTPKPSDASSKPEKPANKPSEPSSQPEQPAKPSHTHNWVAQTTTKQHPAEGHNETIWVQDSAAWDEPIYESRAVCNGCGSDISDNLDHIAWCGGSYSVKQIQTGTTHHPAIGHNETKWVQDKAAWTETITTGYKCSCGATK